MGSCIFCNYKNDAIGTIIFENDYCCGIEIKDDILIGRSIVIPKTHRESVFDLSKEEWNATRVLSDEIKSYLDTKYTPDGYNLGWNVGKVAGQEISHAHLHIIPRYADEPLAGKGICYWVKQKNNKRPG